MLENRVINTILRGASSRQPKISKGTTAYLCFDDVTTWAWPDGLRLETYTLGRGTQEEV